MDNALSRLRQAATAAYTALIVTTMTARRRGHEADEHGNSNDRGDVPGWVMITMMTAIVVIVLLGVFQEAVVTAVKNAFDSISGQGTAGGTTP